MTVKELIQQLKKMPQDALVLAHTDRMRLRDAWLWDDVGYARSDPHPDLHGRTVYYQAKDGRGREYVLISQFLD